jgi:hypothetical protein
VVGGRIHDLPETRIVGGTKAHDAAMPKLPRIQPIAPVRSTEPFDDLLGSRLRPPHAIKQEG